MCEIPASVTSLAMVLTLVPCLMLYLKLMPRPQGTRDRAAVATRTCLCILLAVVLWMVLTNGVRSAFCG